MIEWLQRQDPGRVFLKTPDEAWTYGATIGEVERRIGAGHRSVRPTLEPDAIFDILAGLAGGGVTVVGGDEQPETDPTADLVVYTSGSAGKPKGVRLTMGNLQAAARASMSHLAHDEHDTWLLAMPLHHVAGLSIIIRSAYAGGAVRLVPRFDPNAVAAAMAGDITMVSVVPTMLRRLLEVGDLRPSGLSAVLVGGGPIPAGLLERAADAGLPVLPTYGMTETFGQVATLRPGAPLAYHAHPLPGVEVRIEADGHIALKGDQVSPGYVGEPDREDPWFLTNDLGEMTTDGALVVKGRADTVIVTGGENVAPEVVEARLGSHPGIDEVVVVGLPNPEWGEMVACVYAGSASSDELSRYLSDGVAPHMVPKRWLRVVRIPRTPLGKPDRLNAAGMFADGGNL